MLLEICTTNIQSAQIAQNAGGARIELCSAIDVGGLTPSQGLIKAALNALQIPVNVLIRLREGNFTYNQAELDIMLDDIRCCRDLGVNGVVIGALNNNGLLDVKALEAMKSAAGPLEIVCHRAFDYVKDPFAALEILIDLGFNRILSSGQAASAYEGRFLLQQLIERADNRIQVMPGAGIQPENILEIKQTTNAREFHMTARHKIIQAPDGLAIPGLEWWYWESDAVRIQKALEQIQAH